MSDRGHRRKGLYRKKAVNDPAKHKQTKTRHCALCGVEVILKAGERFSGYCIQHDRNA